MPQRLARINVGQLHRQAKELLQAAKSGDLTALARIRAVSDRLILAAAQLALAREYGFDSWARLKTEVQRREILDSLDSTRLRELLADHPELAIEKMHGWCDHPLGATPLGYVAMMRYDTIDGTWRDVEGTGALARALLEAGAPVEGAPGDLETPLMTAASYGDAEVAKVLVEAGASLTATASPTAGGVANGTALRHAAVFGMHEVADVLLAAGASDLVHAAATGSITDMLTPATPEADRVAALRIAAERGRLNVVDELLASGTPIDGVDRDGSTALHAAAYSGRADSVAHLLHAGADPSRRDTRFHSTPLGWCRHRRSEVGAGQGHDEVERLLAP
ncbi:MAG: ankyrin repeat domain-containing protein [Micromonosporaceae bacterium]